MRGWSRLGVRSRTTATAAVVLALALGAAALLLYTGLQRTRV